jgi:hypothetical protein
MEGYLTHRNLYFDVSTAAATPRCCFFAFTSGCPYPSNLQKITKGEKK